MVIFLGGQLAGQSCWICYYVPSACKNRYFCQEVTCHSRGVQALPTWLPRSRVWPPNGCEDKLFSLTWPLPEHSIFLQNFQQLTPQILNILTRILTYTSNKICSFLRCTLIFRRVRITYFTLRSIKHGNGTPPIIYRLLSPYFPIQTSFPIKPPWNPIKSQYSHHSITI